MVCLRFHTYFQSKPQLEICQMSTFLENEHPPARNPTSTAMPLASRDQGAEPILRRQASTTGKTWLENPRTHWRFPVRKPSWNWGGLDHSQGKWFAPGEALPPGYIITAHPEGHTAPQEGHMMTDKARWHLLKHHEYLICIYTYIVSIYCVYIYIFIMCIYIYIYKYTHAHNIYTHDMCMCKHT